MTKNQKKKSDKINIKKNWPHEDNTKKAQQRRFIIKCEWKDILEFLNEIKERNPSEEDFIKKVKHRVKIIQHDIGELETYNVRSMLDCFYNICPEFPEALGKYLDRNKKKAS